MILLFYVLAAILLSSGDTSILLWGTNPLLTQPMLF